jgi:hypothetical protein
MENIPLLPGKDCELYLLCLAPCEVIKRGKHSTDRKSACTVRGALLTQQHTFRKSSAFIMLAKKWPQF